MSDICDPASLSVRVNRPPSTNGAASRRRARQRSVPARTICAHAIPIQISLARLIANKKISVLAATVAPTLVAAMIGTKLCMAHNRRGAASPIRVVELEPERDEEGETHGGPQPNGKEQSRASLASGSGKLQLIEATPRSHASLLPPSRRMAPTVCDWRINGIALQSKLASPLTQLETQDECTVVYRGAARRADKSAHSFCTAGSPQCPNLLVNGPRNLLQICCLLDDFSAISNRAPPSHHRLELGSKNCGLARAPWPIRFERMVSFL